MALTAASVSDCCHFPADQTKPSIGIPQKFLPKLVERFFPSGFPSCTGNSLRTPAKSVHPFVGGARDRCLALAEWRRRLPGQTGGRLPLDQPSIRTHRKTQQGLLAHLTFSPQAKRTVNRLPIRSEVMLAVELETEVGFVTNAEHESISILLPPLTEPQHCAGPTIR